MRARRTLKGRSRPCVTRRPPVSAIDSVLADLRARPSHLQVGYEIRTKIRAKICVLKNTRRKFSGDFMRGHRTLKAFAIISQKIAQRAQVPPVKNKRPGTERRADGRM